MVFKHIDQEMLLAQQKLLKQNAFTPLQIAPFTEFSHAGNDNDEETGTRALEKGLVGCLMVAGGQGSRLRFDGPKGIFPIMEGSNKSLFQLFAEQVIDASLKAHTPLKAAIMTSEQNHEQTVAFFTENHYFGLKIDQLSFFMQGSLPLLDEKGRVILTLSGEVVEAPDGNGGALHAFYTSGIWQRWYAEGVRYLNFIPVDNPLADPFDPELTGYHIRCNSDVVMKCIERTDPEENVGLIVKEQGKTAIVEYSEISDKCKHARNDDGTLVYRCANISLFEFTMDFIAYLEKCNWKMPLHKAFKEVKSIAIHKDILKGPPFAWKFETFIFDVLPAASKVDVLMCKREICFAPLKNASGQHSITTVREAIKKKESMKKRSNHV